MENVESCNSPKYKIVLASYFLTFILRNETIICILSTDGDPKSYLINNANFWCKDSDNSLIITIFAVSF